MTFSISRWMRWVTVLLAVVAVVWLGYETWRLLLQGDPMGAIDLKQRHVETAAWFAGQTVYGEIVHAVYPPASYVMLWPLLGWLEVEPARWLWALTTIAALAWLIGITIRECGADGRVERTFVGCIPLAIYPTGAAIGNGQLPVHVVPALLTSLLLLRSQRTWSRDVLVSLLMLLALVKPSLSAPFFLILAVAPGARRAASLTVAGYVGLTLVSATFQNVGILDLLAAFLRRAEAGVAWGSAHDVYSSQVDWMAPAGWARLHRYETWIAGMAVSTWIFLQRKKDIWLLMGVTAILGRFATHHGWYDDLLLLIPLIALYRIARRRLEEEAFTLAGGLFLLTLASLVAPGGRYLFPPPWNTVYISAQIVIWFGVLVYLLVHTMATGSERLHFPRTLDPPREGA